MTQGRIRLAPSILSADFTALGREIEAAARGGADLIHVDVMDGHFVPNITVGPLVVSAVKRATSLPVDVHLMITDPDRYLEAFVGAGAGMVSVHVEVLAHLNRTINEIKRLGAQAGAVLNPSTPAITLEQVAADVDFVLVMSVNPGFGGQRFIPSSLQKIRAVRELLDRAGNHSAAVEVDGGIDRTTIAGVVEAGAEILVAGHAIFADGQAESAVRALKAAALAAAQGRTR
jgi:ribulose-phosphate 3-epimerase